MNGHIAHSTGWASLKQSGRQARDHDQGGRHHRDHDVDGVGRVATSCPDSEDQGDGGSDQAEDRRSSAGDPVVRGCIHRTNVMDTPATPATKSSGAAANPT